MLVLQSKDTFIRTFDKVGYIFNQKTKAERLYDETGVDYLKTLSRSPKEVNEIIHTQLLPLYADATFETLYDDFTSFLHDLAENGFVFIGEDDEEVKASESNFKIADYKKSEKSSFVEKTTQEAILDLTGESPYLMSLQFELTSRCNERCIHCYIPDIKKDKGIDMPLPLFKKAINQFSEMGGLQVSLSGGEIFMHKHIVDMINYCREKDMQIMLLSNLISLNNDHIKSIREANVNMVQVSLYSMDEKIHDSITTVSGSYRKTKKSIELLVDNEIPVMISCPLMKSNANSYHDILMYAHSLGIKAQTDFILMAEEDMNTEKLKHRISMVETENVIREILHNEGVDSIDAMKDTSPAELFPLKLSQPVCAAGRTNLCINANGDITPCNGWQGFKAGNLCTNTLSEIWKTSKKLKELRGITRSSFPECINCEAKEYCSLCMARNYNESNGNYLKINPRFCEIAFLNKRIHEEMIGKEIRV